ncbi:MAG: hypothetical protein IJ518_08400 [Clostridia bacterium]|nr:hypothetical protein [Clostridia bacterium]
MLDLYTVSFFGHRYIDNILKIEELLVEQIRMLIAEKDYVEFLVGRHGDFDQCVSSAVLRAQKAYHDANSSLVLVLPYLTAECRNNQKQFEDYYSHIEIAHAAANSHPKAAIRLRNREMVDRSDLVICYIEKKHGGAWQAVKYAIENNKKIINLAEGENLNNRK